MAIYKKTVTANADALAAIVTSLSSPRGAGLDQHLPVGLGPNHKARSYVGFAQADIAKACKGATQLVAATFKLYIGPGVHQTNGGSPRMWVQRLLQALNAGNGGGGATGHEAAWSTTNGGGVLWLKGGSNDGVTFTTTGQVDKVITIPGSGTGWIGIDVADLIEAAGLPAAVLKRSGAAGPGGSLFGFRLASNDDTLASRAIEFLSLESGTRPYLELTLDNNHAPNAPIITAPVDVATNDSGTITTESGTEFTVEFTHDDPLDKKTHWTKARLQVFATGTTVAQMNATPPVGLKNDVTIRAPAGSTPQTGRITVGRNDPRNTDPPMTRRTARLWRIMTVDDQGKAGKWSTPRTVTPNAKPKAVNVRIEQGTRTPTITVGISDLDSVLGGTNGRIKGARAVVYLDLPSPDPDGRTFITMLDTGKVDPGGLPTVAVLPYSGSPSTDLDWGATYRGFVEIWDDSNTGDTDGKSDQVIFKNFVPRITVGPATVLPNSKDPVQTALRHAFTIGDTNPFDSATVRWYRQQDSQVPYWAQTHVALNAVLAQTPSTGATTIKLTGTPGALIPGVAVGDILQIKTGAVVDSRVVTGPQTGGVFTGTFGAAGTGITLSVGVSAGHLLTTGTVRTLQLTRSYSSAGPIGALGNDWGSEPWLDAAVRPTGAVNYAATSERKQIRFDAKPLPPGPFSVVGGVDSGNGYWVVGGASPPTLHWPYRDPDVLLGYTDPRTSRLLTIKLAASPFTQITGSPFTVAGTSEDYAIGGGLLTKDVTYQTNAADTDTAGQQGPAAATVGLFRWSTAPVFTGWSPLAGGGALTDPTPFYNWICTFVAGKTQKQFQLVLTDITDVATGGDPIEVYDSGVVPYVVASGATAIFQVPPYNLIRTGRTIRTDLTVWDTDNLSTTKTWTYTTSFTKPATLQGLTLAPDQVESQVTGAWSATGKDTWFVEYLVARRIAGEEFERILMDQFITTETFIDEDAPIGAVVDYRVTQHTGALESDSDAGSEQSMTISPAMRWRVKYSDAYNFDIEETQTYRVDEQLLEATLQPLPGDDPQGRTMPVVLSGGEGPRSVTLSLLIPPDRLYQLAWLREIRRSIIRDGDYMTLKSPDGTVLRCRPGAVPTGDGKQDWATSDVTFLETE